MLGELHTSAPLLGIFVTSDCRWAVDRPMAAVSLLIER